jgi:lysophospholipase L1-like esterase
MTAKHPDEKNGEQAPASEKRSSIRAARGCAYLLFLGLTPVMLLFLAEFITGFLLPPPDFPPGGLASPPLEDKTMEYKDFRYTASTNSMGLRDEEIPAEKEHAFRIAAIGDSYTYGWGVELEDAWIKQLETELRKAGLDVEIVNAGQPGVGPVEYLRNTRAAMTRLHPDMILIGLLQGNDLNQCYLPPHILWMARFFPNLTRLVQEWDTLYAERKPLPESRGVQSSETHRAFLRDVAAQMLEELDPAARQRFDQLDPEVRELYHAGMINPWMVTEGVSYEDFFTQVTDLDHPVTQTKIRALGFLLGQIRKCAAAGGASVVAVSVPNGVYDNRYLFERVKRLGYQVNPAIQKSKAPDRAARMACEAAGVPFYEVTEVFRNRFDDPDLYFEFDHHFTPAGHRLFATHIAPFIRKVVEKQMQ